MFCLLQTSAHADETYVKVTWLFHICLVVKSSFCEAKYHKRAKMVNIDTKNPNYDPEKSNVLQESKVFHESPVNPRKCADILANILYMINKG